MAINIELEAFGENASGKTRVLNIIKELLELEGMTVSMKGEHRMAITKQDVRDETIKDILTKQEIETIRKHLKKKLEVKTVNWNHAMYKKTVEGYIEDLEDLSSPMVLFQLKGTLDEKQHKKIIDKIIRFLNENYPPKLFPWGVLE